MTHTVDATALANRSSDIFDTHQSALHRRTDRMFAVLMGLQWLGALLTALVLSPRTWAGTSSEVHPHVWAAGVLGLVVASLPVSLSLLRPGGVSTRFSIAVAQALTSGLLIHITDGRIETHFHIFGSLAFLAVYRDVRVLLIYSGVVVVDHLARGLFWPQSVFGSDLVSVWRPLEHAGWVVFENVFLILTCLSGRRDLRELASRQARLELAQGEIQARVVEPLMDSARELTEAMLSLTITTEDQRRMLSRQAQALSETQVTATEIQRTSEETSRQAEVIMESTTQAGDAGTTAQAMIGKSMLGLEGIRSQASELSGQLEKLGARARKLNDIAATVKDLADQSNMVAVNAAIEAARSGETGRGFAVVATEMRRLARQSQQATGEVRVILDETMKSIQAVMTASKRGSERMSMDLEVVRESGESLRGLTSMMENSTDSVRRISAAVGQQAAGVSQLFGAVNDLSAMMTETLGRLDSAASATVALQSVTDRVQRVIQTYQPESHRPS
ncbi:MULTISPECIES: methyl-accepting chemotaxis protein [Myxococcus]|uniref:Chemotaxis protein n=1 Tax=Myxococcus llanfairpwllgwyngyllgogerychwyrndrobwllllantysiliogogogochensis TaxID=2590453 RepID=A0A540WVD2_9BACT|nr:MULTISPECIES: methyl-accepting chemotaxis protein [Myxococcus]NTX06710.1 chemotaxis protein [Myxococcus sp. CA040A]TQF12394.1 chemotaxis protein [Myxococcus llanfairpwllgwyngyllgogerychwyrndrobwllllantysiliogogogochensis]